MFNSQKSSNHLHNKYFEELRRHGSSLVGRIASAFYMQVPGSNLISYWIANEIMVRQDNSSTYRRVDASIIIEPTYGQKCIGGNHNIIIDFKTTRINMLNSDMETYLGFSEMYFLATPGSLIEDAADTIFCHYRSAHFKGLINLDTMEILIMPSIQQEEKRNLLAVSTMLSYRVFSNQNGRYGPYSTPIIDISDEFMIYKGFVINKKYKAELTKYIDYAITKCV